MAGNIPIARIPDLQQASYMPTAPRGTTGHMAQAVGQIGRAAGQSASVLDAYADKKRRLLTDATVHGLQTAATEADAEIEKVKLENPDNTQLWQETRDRLYGEIHSNLNLEGLDEAGIQATNQLYEKLNTRSGTKLQQAGEIRQIDNANASLLQAARGQYRSGNREGAAEIIGKMQIPNSEKIQLLQAEGSRGIYQGIIDGVRNPYATIADLQEIEQGLLEKDKQGNFKNYEFVDSGLDISQRNTAISEVRAKIRAHQHDASRSIKDAMKKIPKGEAYELSPHVPDNMRDTVDRLGFAHTDGKGSASPEFESLIKKIENEKAGSWFFGREGLDVNEKAQLWKTIRGGDYDEDNNWVATGTQFNQDAQIELSQAMVALEERDLSNSEEDVEGFWDREISPLESRVRSALNGRLWQSLEAMKKVADPSGVTAGSYGAAYEKILSEIRDDAGELTNENVGAYIEKELTDKIRRYVQPLDERRATESLDQAFTF